MVLLAAVLLSLVLLWLILLSLVLLATVLLSLVLLLTLHLGLLLRLLHLELPPLHLSFLKLLQLLWGKLLSDLRVLLHLHLQVLLLHQLLLSHPVAIRHVAYHVTLRAHPAGSQIHHHAWRCTSSHQRVVPNRATSCDWYATYTCSARVASRLLAPLLAA